MSEKDGAMNSPFYVISSTQGRMCNSTLKINTMFKHLISLICEWKMLCAWPKTALLGFAMISFHYVWVMRNSRWYTSNYYPCRQGPDGWAFPQESRPSSAWKGDMGLSSSGPTTHRRSHRGVWCYVDHMAVKGTGLGGLIPVYWSLLLAHGTLSLWKGKDSPTGRVFHGKHLDFPTWMNASVLFVMI